jgi:hypothetical protein
VSAEERYVEEALDLVARDWGIERTPDVDAKLRDTGVVQRVALGLAVHDLRVAIMADPFVRRLVRVRGAVFRGVDRLVRALLMGGSRSRWPGSPGT